MYGCVQVKGDIIGQFGVCTCEWPLERINEWINTGKIEITTFEKGFLGKYQDILNTHTNIYNFHNLYKNSIKIKIEENLQSKNSITNF